MAVRVRLRLSGSEGEVVSSAVLNGGFEIPGPHVLLPAPCAERLLGDYKASGRMQTMEAAGGHVELLFAQESLTVRVHTDDHEGREVRFHAIVSEQDPEVLVSDSGIDALGVRIESFVPGQWRYAEETLIRDSEPPQHW